MQRPSLSRLVAAGVLALTLAGAAGFYTVTAQPHTALKAAPTAPVRHHDHGPLPMALKAAPNNIAAISWVDKQQAKSLRLSEQASHTGRATRARLPSLLSRMV